jgi:hypothetical protein
VLTGKFPANKANRKRRKHEHGFGPFLACGSTWAVGWYIDPSTDNHNPLVLQGISGVWSAVPNPSCQAGSDSGFSAITTIPGGGLWAVGVTSNSKGNYSTLIEFHP